MIEQINSTFYQYEYDRNQQLYYTRSPSPFLRSQLPPPQPPPSPHSFLSEEGNPSYITLEVQPRINVDYSIGNTLHVAVSSVSPQPGTSGLNNYRAPSPSVFADLNLPIIVDDSTDDDSTVDFEEYIRERRQRELNQGGEVLVTVDTEPSGGDYQQQAEQPSQQQQQQQEQEHHLLICNICIESSLTDRPTVLGCGHMYHNDCLLRWIAIQTEILHDEGLPQRNTCPNCRALVDPNNLILLK